MPITAHANIARHIEIYNTYMYKTAVCTLVNGGIQGLTHQKQHKS